MKINQSQLNNYLKNQVNKPSEYNNFYWLNSEDGFLLQEALKKIKKLISHLQPDLDKIVYHIDSNADWSTIYNSIQTPGLFSTHSIIELHFINKITVEQQQKLVQLTELSSRNTATIIVIYPFRIDNKTLKQKWLTTLDTRGVIITIWPPSNAEYPGWLKAECQKYQLSFASSDCFNYLAQKTMGNPGAAAQTLYRLKLQDKVEISLELLQQILSEHANYSIFDLTAAYLQNNTKLCLIILQTLKQQDTAILLVLWALRKELELLGETLESAVETKQSPSQIINNNPAIWSSKKNELSRALNTLTLDIIYQSMLLIADIEYSVKTSTNEIFIWQQIEQLLLLPKLKRIQPTELN